MKLVPTWLETGWQDLTRPISAVCIRAGIRPNHVTTVGILLILVSAIFYGSGHIRLGGLFLLLSGWTDMIDGQVARGGGMSTKFGAFYDSTLDRVGDGLTFIGIGAFFLLYPADLAWRQGVVILCMVAVLASLLVSYARARAEGLGLDGKVGIAQRAERILGLGLPSLFLGYGQRGIVLSAIVLVLTLLALITVVQRFVWVYKQTGGA
ncbi:MAG TPA: CDP-alcohol phosphatidyltransferase family protein [Gemmatimonadales bacterium]|nr:CDP-alcohol phosphatidyltransferase family protein [Gemmatimonadales bacterium]